MPAASTTRAPFLIHKVDEAATNMPSNMARWYGDTNGLEVTLGDVYDCRRRGSVKGSSTFMTCIAPLGRSLDFSWRNFLGRGAVAGNVEPSSP